MNVKQRLTNYSALEAEVFELCTRLDHMEQAGHISDSEIESIEQMAQRHIAEMESIRNAVDALPDPRCRRVLRLRYIDCEHGKPTKWKYVAAKIFGNYSEKNAQAVFRLHNRALKSIEALLPVGE